MKQRTLTLIIVALILVVGGCGDDESNPTSSRTMKDMYGTWAGQMNTTFTIDGEEAHTTDAVILDIDPDGAAMWLSGEQVPCAIADITPTTVVLDVQVSVVNLRATGTRHGSQMSMSVSSTSIPTLSGTILLNRGGKNGAPYAPLRKLADELEEATPPWP